jgi:hypothetical protein
MYRRGPVNLQLRSTSSLAPTCRSRDDHVANDIAMAARVVDVEKRIKATTSILRRSPGSLAGDLSLRLGLSSSVAPAATRRRHSNQEVIPFTALVFVSDQPPWRLTTPGPGLVRIGRITVFRRDRAAL